MTATAFSEGDSRATTIAVVVVVVVIAIVVVVSSADAGGSVVVDASFDCACARASLFRFCLARASLSSFSL